MLARTVFFPLNFLRRKYSLPYPENVTNFMSDTLYVSECSFGISPEKIVISKHFSSTAGSNGLYEKSRCLLPQVLL